MQDLKRTKIVATLGPSTSTPEMIENLMKSGVNAFRLNFSHGTHESHAQLIAWIKEIREKLNLPVAILQDLCGPKIRLGMIGNGGIDINPGDTIILDTSITENEGNVLPVTYQGFAHDVKEGHQLLLADGNFELKIKKVRPPQVECEVITGGHLTSKKGINYPEGSFSLPAITKKDKEDLRFGLEQGVDFVALSFIKTGDDVNIAREIVNNSGASVQLIAKIEKHEAIANFFEILHNVDGIMVARGDLGVEIPLEKVPFVQKKIIRLSNLYGKPVITATQMLLSMVDSPRPTRAESTDIANAILDGTDAIMLSDETASGNFPLEAVRTMNRLARETEKNFSFYVMPPSAEGPGEISIPQAISHAATNLAKEIDARAILCPTSSGFTAKMISRFRPKASILGLTPNLERYYQLALLWGVVPGYLPIELHMDKLLENAVRLAEESGVLEKEDRYVITAGFPFGMGGDTNLIRAGKLD